MKFKNLITKLLEANASADQEIFLELFEATDDGGKCLKIPIQDIGEDNDNLVISGYVEKAFITKWEKRKTNPINWTVSTLNKNLAEAGREAYFPIKKKIKLTLPKETEIK
tara:strand:+ start:95 stop:424 length:330 start_codon:yes stop_codon:yes gene_type:complete